MLKEAKEQKRIMQQENEEKKIYLQSYRIFKQKARRIEEQLSELRLDEMLPSLPVSDMPSTHNHRDLSDYMVKYDKLYSQLIKARKDTIERFAEVSERIELMENENEKTVLVYRYLRNYNWEKICVEMNYSWRQVHYIHGKALEHFRMIA